MTKTFRDLVKEYLSADDDDIADFWDDPDFPDLSEYEKQLDELYDNTIHKKKAPEVYKEKLKEIEKRLDEERKSNSKKIYEE